MVLKETQVEREEIFSGHVFNVYKDTVQIETKGTATREVIEHSGGVAILAFATSGNILLVSQYRYGVHTELLELPAGKIDACEDPKECGMRELTEETGYEAERFEYLTNMFPTPGYSGEIITIYTAKDLVFKGQNLDENEYISVSEVPLKTAVEMCLDGRITDAKTIVGVLTYNAKEN